MWHTIKTLLISPWLVLRIFLIVLITFLVRYKYGLELSLDMLRKKMTFSSDVTPLVIENMTETNKHLWMFPKYQKGIMEILDAARETHGR